MMGSMRELARGARLVLLLAAVAAPAAAQEFRGTITGRVTDRSDAVLPGTTVTVTNTDTGVATTAVTNADGIYLVSFLTPGPYRVGAELMGFKKLQRDGVVVRIADRITIDLTLEVGQLEEVVQVAAAAPLLDVSSASQGQVIDEKRISLLPL